MRKLCAAASCFSLRLSEWPLGGLLLAMACGYHDTPLATYDAPLPDSSQGGTGTNGAATAGTAGVAGIAGAAGEAPVPFEPACAATYPTLIDGLTSHYRLVSPGQKWVTAESDCESDGGHLVIVDNQAENIWLQSVAQQTMTDSGSSNQLIWLGLSDQRTEGEFRWVNGATLGQTYWAASEPSSLASNEDCVELRKTGEWNDDHCAAKLSYVCECDGARSANEWCDTDLPASCGDCSTTCAPSQTCSVQLCK